MSKQPYFPGEGERRGDVEVRLSPGGSLEEVVVCNESGRVVFQLTRLSADELHLRVNARGGDPDLRVLIYADAAVRLDYAWEGKATAPLPR